MGSFLLLFGKSQIVIQILNGVPVKIRDRLSPLKIHQGSKAGLCKILYNKKPPAISQEVFYLFRFGNSKLSYNVFNTSFILLTAAALLSNVACSSAFNLKSNIFSQPFFPMITGTPIQISF